MSLLLADNKTWPVTNNYANNTPLTTSDSMAICILNGSSGASLMATQSFGGATEVDFVSGEPCCLIKGYKKEIDVI